MKILIVHNQYQNPGGEDVMVAQETELLRSQGHTVLEYRRSNEEIKTFGWWDKATLAKRVLWAADSVRELRQLLQREKPDVAHFHNTFVLISPSAVPAVRQMGVPIVQTLHNYRLLCARADFYRDGKICEECLGRTLPWPAVWYRCYHDSRVQTAGVAAIQMTHRWLRRRGDPVDRYLTPTEFTRQKFIEGGIPPARIQAVPNFVNRDPGVRSGSGRYAVFVGRFFPNKRVITILRAWKHFSDIPLKLIGSGPREQALRQEAEALGLRQVEFLGWQAHETALSIIKEASFLVSASEWYETFQLVIVEAFACGVPVICPRLGAMQELVEDGRTGLHFTPGDSEELAAKAQWAWTHPNEMEAMGRAARAEFESKYTSQCHYEHLMRVFQEVISQTNMEVT